MGKFVCDCHLQEQDVWRLDVITVSWSSWPDDTAAQDRPKGTFDGDIISPSR